ncbi:hypothetical protein EON77_14580, partial [bacterium]
PAKFIYKKMAESPTTEVAMMHTVADDLYLVVGQINPTTKLATLQIHINPLVSWIWLGCIVLILGSVVCMWPELLPGESRVWNFARGTAAVTASVMLGIFVAVLPAKAQAQGSSSHAGVVHIENEKERDIFSALKCMCGGCQRLPISTCACPEAEDVRKDVRAKLARGVSRDEIIAEYKVQFGTDGLTVPPNSGALRAIYVLPLGLILAGGVGLAVAVRGWRKPALATSAEESDAAAKSGTNPKREGGAKDDYDARLDEELRDLDG